MVVGFRGKGLVDRFWKGSGGYGLERIWIWFGEVKVVVVDMVLER